MKAIESIVRHHHERYDGKGYPDRLAGDKIPSGARIVAVAEAFQAWSPTCFTKVPAPSKMPWPNYAVAPDLQFDPKIVGAFLDRLQTDAASPERQKA